MTRPLVVVLTGGTARRLGGVDKTALDVGGRPLLLRLLAAVTTWPTVVVGPAAGAGPGVLRTREQPPGGGPLAGVAAGARAGRAAHPDVDVLVVLAGDQPFAGRVVPALLAAVADPDVDAALAVGPDGRAQPLLAAYRWTAVADRLATGTHHRPARELATGLRHVLVPAAATDVLDVDDEDDLRAARDAARDLAGDVAGDIVRAPLRTAPGDGAGAGGTGTSPGQAGEPPAADR